MLWHERYEDKSPISKTAGIFALWCSAARNRTDFLSKGVYYSGKNIAMENFYVRKIAKWYKCKYHLWIRATFSISRTRYDWIEQTASTGRAGRFKIALAKWQNTPTSFYHASFNATPVRTPVCKNRIPGVGLHCFYEYILIALVITQNHENSS